MTDATLSTRVERLERLLLSEPGHDTLETRLIALEARATAVKQMIHAHDELLLLLSPLVLHHIPHQKTIDQNFVSVWDELKRLKVKSGKARPRR